MNGWRRTTLAAGRLLVGPLALAAFFLRWADGPGVLAGTGFSGYDLLRFSGNLRALDLSLTQGAALWGIRLAILVVPIAAAWQTLLAPAWRWHVGYAVSGCYLVVFTAAVAIAGVVRSGLIPPSPGFGLLLLASALFISTWTLAPVAGEASARA